VVEQDEVGILGEAINHRQDHRLACHLWQTFDEVDGYVRPHLGGNLEWLQEACQRARVGLVTLARGACTNPGLDQCLVTGDVEVRAQAMQGFLDPFMSCRVCHLQHLVAQVVVVGEEDTTAVKEETAVEALGRLELTCAQAPQHLQCVGRPCRRLVHVIEEGEGRA
jgi:hypothetical protein